MKCFLKSTFDYILNFRILDFFADPTLKGPYFEEKTGVYTVILYHPLESYVILSAPLIKIKGPVKFWMQKVICRTMAIREL